MTSHKTTLILIAISLVFGFIYLKNIGIINGNTYEVNMKDPLDIENLKIYQGFFTISRHNDLIMFEDDSKSMFFDGRKLKMITTDHGENDFLITYKDSLYYQFRYFKTNSRMIDDFKFNFYLQNDSLFLNMEIHGTNKLSFTRSFNEILNASKLRTNIPIDSTGTMHNGLELID